MKPLLLIAALLAINSHAQTFPMLSTTTNRTVTGGVTNLALLNGTNAFTPSAFFPANKIGTRVLFATNLYVASISTVSSDLTNNGDYANGTTLFTFTSPALLGRHSAIYVDSNVTRSNANAVTARYSVFLGSNTNFCNDVAALSTAAARSAGPVKIFENWGSYTNQMQGSSTTLILSPTNLVDTSSPFTVYVAAWVRTTVYTNAFVHLIFYEIPAD